jgi:hypothetical protein
VTGVVREEAHQHGLTGVKLHLAIALALEFDLEHIRTPPIEAVLDDPPR